MNDLNHYQQQQQRQQQHQLIDQQHQQSSSSSSSSSSFNHQHQINLIPNHNSFNLNPSSQSIETGSDQIKNALSGLTPDTRQSLLLILLAAQSNHQQQQQQQQSIYHQLQSNNWNRPINSSLNQESQLSSPILAPHDLSKLPFHPSHSQQQPDSIIHELTPVLSPNMTPLSSFSTNSFQNPSSVISDSLSSSNQNSACNPLNPSPFHQTSSNHHQIELFSPLTSPALRPIGHESTHSINRNDPNNHLLSNFHQSLTHNIPALIDQAAALGLSTTHPHPFISSNSSPTSSSSSTTTTTAPTSLSTTADLNSQALPTSHHQTNYLSHSSSPIFQSPNFIPNPTINPSKQLNVSHQVGINLPSEPATQSSSPILLPHHPSTHLSIHSPCQTKLTGRQRPARNSKSRPSPLFRPIDKSNKPGDDRTNGPTKRARNSTSGISVSISPNFPGGLAKIGLMDSPSPIDLHSHEVISTFPSTSSASSSSSVSALDQNSKSSQSPAIGPQTSLVVPPPKKLVSIPSNPNGWCIQPLTPASLFNFEPPVVAETTMADPTHDRARNGMLNGTPKVNDQASCESGKTTKSTIDQDMVPGCSHLTSQGEKTNPVEVTGKSTKGTTSSGRAIEKKSSTGCLKTKKVKIKEVNGQGGSKANGTSKSNAGGEIEREAEKPEMRKSSHKVAEQRRRDSLKMCFEVLRQILPPIQSSEKDDEPAQERRPGEGNVGGQRGANAFDPLNPNKGISKVTLLKHSNEYIIKLKDRLKKRDRAVDLLVKLLANHQLNFFVDCDDQRKGSGHDDEDDHPDENNNLTELNDVEALLKIIQAERLADKEDLRLASQPRPPTQYHYTRQSSPSEDVD